MVYHSPLLIVPFFPYVYRYCRRAHYFVPDTSWFSPIEVCFFLAVCFVTTTTRISGKWGKSENVIFWIQVQNIAHNNMYACMRACVPIKSWWPLFVSRRIPYRCWFVYSFFCSPIYVCQVHRVYLCMYALTFSVLPSFEANGCDCELTGRDNNPFSFSHHVTAVCVPGVF